MGSRSAMPAEPGSHIGPVVNKRQWDQIQGYIQKGIDEGARLVAGGSRPARGLQQGLLRQARRSLPTSRRA
jgi:aldehyde dehydrogenase (NAD+)